MSSDLFDKGLDIRKAVLGDEYVERALNNRNEFNAAFQDLVTEYCWGWSWGREGLSKKQRSLNNICMLCALNRPEEFKVHFRGALRNGASIEELRETLLQIAIYCGIPAGVEAFRLATPILKEWQEGEGGGQ